MKAPLKKFLANLKNSDFNGSNTAEEIKAKAEGFLNSDNYKSYEQFEAGAKMDAGKYDIHNTLLSLIYDQV